MIDNHLVEECSKGRVLGQNYFPRCTLTGSGSSPREGQEGGDISWTCPGGGGGWSQ